MPRKEDSQLRIPGGSSREMERQGNAISKVMSEQAQCYGYVKIPHGCLK